MNSRMISSTAATQPQKASAAHSSLQDQQQQLELLAGSWQRMEARLLTSLQQEVKQQMASSL